MIYISVPGEPVAKGRPLFSRSSGIVRTPAKTVKYENLVRMAAAATVTEPLQGALEVQIDAYFTIPASRPVWWRDLAAYGKVWHSSRPDLDNVVKAVCDGCETVVWQADSVIARIVASKRYSAMPRVEIRVQGLTGAHSGTRTKADLER